MNTTVERLEDDRVKMAVTVPADFVDRHIAAAYAEIGSKVKVPGFRKGHVPRPIVDNYVGAGAVLSEALENVVSEAYPLALDVEGLRPIESPDTGDLDALTEGSEYTFTVEVTVRPELTLSSTDKIEVTVPPSQATDREVEAQIGFLRDKFATLEIVTDRGIADGDFALISFTGTLEGESYEGNSVDKYLYETGRGLMPSEFDAALIGAVAGDERHVEFAVPEGNDNEQHVGKTAAFDIVVHEVKTKQLPEVDDEFASSVGGFETADELREDIRNRMNESKAVAHPRLVERAAREALTERLEGTVPGVMADSRAETMTREFFETLEERGYSLEEYLQATGTQPQQIQADILIEARAAVSQELALEALFRQQGMELTDEMVTKELERMTEGTGQDVEELRTRLASTGVMSLVREQLTHQLAVRWLMENVTVIEAEPTDDESEAKE